jgi:hypothetical protein
MTDYASIKIKSKTKSSADRLMKKFEMNGLEFYDSVMEYFEVTGVNPKDQVILSPAEELKKLRDTIVSFMRKQEKDFIVPTFGHIETLIARFLLYIEEEAPKKGDPGGQNKLKNIVTSSKILMGENKEIHENVNVKSETKNEEYNLLLEKKYFLTWKKNLQGLIKNL